MIDNDTHGNAHGATPREPKDRSYFWVLLLLVSLTVLGIGLFIGSQGWSAIPVLMVVGGILGGFFAVILLFWGKRPKDDADNPASPYNE